METQVNTSQFDDVLEKQKFLLFEKLLGMAKKGYKIGGIINEKKKLEKEAGLENIEFSDKRMENIVSSMLFYTAYFLGSIDDVLEEINDIKEELKISNIDFKITDSIKKTIAYGITEYRFYSKFPDAKNELEKDIEKLKNNGLYLEDKKQTIEHGISSELEGVMTIN